MNMIVREATVPATFVPYALDPDRDRRRFEVAEGVTVADIIALVLPDQPDAVLDRVVVVLVSAKGGRAHVRREIWHRVRPHAGTNVMITIGPGAGAISLLVSVAAQAISSFGGGLMAGTFGLSAAQWGSIIGFGVTALGGLLVNALFQPKKKKEDKASFIVDGWQNPARLDEQLPDVFGEIRHAPPVAASTYIEVVGDILYNRAVFVHGLAPIELSKHRIGDTPIEEYDEFMLEHRGVVGHPSSSTPLTLYTEQVYEDSIATDLVREYERDDAGELLPGKPYKAPKPVRRFTGQNASHAIVVLSFPAGLAMIKSSNGKKIAQSVTIERRIRKGGTVTWITLPTITITNKKTAGFFRAVRFDFPSRGAWEIELTRTSASEVDAESSYILNCTWALLQTFRKEYPINTDAPLALTAMRVKATAQMNGKVETYNAVAKRVTTNFGNGWPTNKPSNPATSSLWAILGPGLYKTQPSNTIDWPRFQEWFAYCELKGLKFDHYLTGNQTLQETLKMTGAAGRAAVYFDGSKWTVVVDKPRDVPIDVLTPRNASDIVFETVYPDIPDALRVKFQDATNDYETAERIIPRPGLAGAPQVTEAIEMPGKTDPAEIYREAVRRFFEIQYRNTSYRATQDGLTRSATRGDLVMASHDILKRSMASGRVRAIRDSQVELDEIITFQPGIDYAIGFRTVGTDDPGIGSHHVRRIDVIVGESRSFRLQGEGVDPPVGAITMIGEYGSESIPLILTGVQSREDNKSDLFLLPAAEIIDESTDAITVPEWDGKVGGEIDMTSMVPLPPKLQSAYFDPVTSLANVTLTPDPIGIVPVASYNFRHRAVGAGIWNTGSTSAEDALAALAGYSLGQIVEIETQSVSIYGVPSAWGSTITFTISAPSNEIVNPGFDSGASWSLGTGWAIAGGIATKTAGVASDLSQTVVLVAGQSYSGSIVVSGRTAGSITVRLVGSSTAISAAISVNGIATFSLTAPPAAASFVVNADSAFNGSVDNVLLYAA